MLTGYFTMRSYGYNVSKDVLPRCPDKWYVQGDLKIKDVKPGKAIGALSRVSKSLGQDIAHDVVAKKVLDFYNEHGHAPTKEQMGTRMPGWTVFLRELGVCPHHGATVEDIKAELRRIHQREGTVRVEHLKRAKLYEKSVVRKRKTGKNWRSLFEEWMTEMGIPHDLRMGRERDLPLYLSRYLAHLDAGGDRRNAPHYSTLYSRGLLDYADASAALHELRKKYGPLLDR